MSESALEKVVRLAAPKPGALVKLTGDGERNVATPEGAKKYGKPIGARISDVGSLSGMTSGAKVTSYDKQRKAATHFTKKGQKWHAPGYGPRTDAEFDYDIKSPGKELMEGHMNDASHLDAPEGGGEAPAPQEKASPVKPGAKVNSREELASAPEGTKITLHGAAYTKKGDRWVRDGEKGKGATSNSLTDNFGFKQGDVKWA